MNAPVNMGQKVSLVDLTDAGMVQRIGDFVRERSGSLFHDPRWLQAVEQGTGQRGGGFVAEQMGAITGWLPLTELRSLLFGKALVSSGFGVGGGILAEDTDVVSQIVLSSVEYAGRFGFGNIELRGGPIPEGWMSHDDKHCSFERALAQDDEAELMAIPRKARAEVRKGLKNDLDISIGREKADRAAHYAVYAESVRNLGTPVFPKKLFGAMLDVFPETSDILTVRRDGKPIASVLSFYHNGAVMPFWGGGAFAARGARANELMYYELMCHARRKGMERFDFGRSKTGSGPYKFKKNWGFDPQRLTYSTWAANPANMRDVDPTSATYARKIAVWKQLPLPIANWIGPAIARGLA